MRATDLPQTFGAYEAPSQSVRQWLASIGASSAIYAAVVIVAIAIGSVTKEIVREKALDVTFVEKVVQEPPPPPPPVVEAKPPPAAAPVVRPDQKIRRLDKPPPP